MNSIECILMKVALLHPDSIKLIKSCLKLRIVLPNGIGDVNHDSQLYRFYIHNLYMFQKNLEKVIPRFLF